jgi:phospholipid transport system transporter-binding protein
VNATADVRRVGDADWTVSGVLDVGTIPAVLAASRALWGSAPELTVDLSAVTRIDSAALALLIEWRRDAARRGRRLTIRGAPTAIASIAELCGVRELLPASDCAGT